MQLVVTMVELNGRSAEPTQESAEDEEVAEATDGFPAPRPLLEATTPATFLLLRSINAKFGVILQELFVFGIEGQRNGLLGLVEVHGGRRR